MKATYRVLAIGALVGLMAVSSAMAMSVTSAVDGSYNLMGPCNDFTNWALAGGATNNGFETFKTALSADEWMSGTQATSAWANIVIPFSFSSAIESARLDYGAVCVPMGNNWGRVLLDISVDGGASYVNIFTGNSDAGEPAYNYTTSQTPSDPMNWWRGYTDISALVAGKSAFDLQVTVLTSWTSWSYNGGAFLPSGEHGSPAFSDPNFYLSGKTAVVPEPSSLASLAGLLVSGLAIIKRRKH